MVGELWGLFQMGLSLSTKYLDTFCEAQVITKWIKNRPEPKKVFKKLTKNLELLQEKLSKNQ